MVNIEICNNCNSEIEISEFNTVRNNGAKAGRISTEGYERCIGLGIK